MANASSTVLVGCRRYLNDAYANHRADQGTGKEGEVMKNGEDPKLNINVRLLHRVQEAILKWPKSFNLAFVGNEHPPMRFNPKKMKEPECKSSACIAGWAYVLGTGKPLSMVRNGVMDKAQELLGLSDSQAFNLFTPLLNKRYRKVTPQEAVAAIDRLIATRGVGDPWKKARKVVVR